MKMLEDDRAARNWTSGGDLGAAPEAPAAQSPRPKRRDAPLTAYGGAQDLYGAMSAARHANLAKLTGEAQQADAPVAEGRAGGARILGWAILVAAGAAAAARRCLRRLK